MNFVEMFMFNIRRFVAVFGLLAVFFAANAQSFSEQELTIIAPDGVAMGATLSVPSALPKAAVVLATGSGTQNRDEEIFGKRPFKVIAETLASQGFAVLRVDDRGLDNPADAATATIETFAADVAAAVSVADSLFANIPTGILGHSAGGSYAIVNAAHNPKTDFIITLAAPAWSGDSLIMSQSRAIATALTGRWDAENLQRRLMDIAKSSLPEFAARASIVAAMGESLGLAAKMPGVAQQLGAQADALLSPWYRSMLRYDPAADIKAVKVPWLAMNGSKDVQVLPSNLQTIKKLNSTVDTVLVEGQNHLFLPCVTGMVDEYATLPGDISSEVLAAITEWLKSRF